MPLPIYPTEEIARETIEGLQAQIDQLISATNDNNLAAWDTAACAAREIALVTDVVAGAIRMRGKETNHMIHPAFSSAIAIVKP